MKKSLSILASSILLPLLAVDIYLAGDSTMADYPAEHAPQTGWGQALKLYAKPGVKVYNFARGGRSTKSFRREGRWAMLLKQVSPGDFVFIQFAHNDAYGKAKNPQFHSDPETEYFENICQFIRDVRAKKAVPVVCTPIVWMSFRNGRIYQSEFFGKYTIAARKAAAEEKADLIDLNEWSKQELTRLGGDVAKTYYMWLKSGQYPHFPQGRQDSCHLQENGAHFYAKGMIALARKQKLAVAECFNDTPAVKPVDKVCGNGNAVSIKDDFSKSFDGDAAGSPWEVICQGGSESPVCRDGILSIDHRNGVLLITGKAKIIEGKFKARIRINDMKAPFNAYIGMATVSPLLKYGAIFHFCDLNLRATVSVDGKRKSTPPLKKGQWHEVEIIYSKESISYLFDGKLISSGAAPEEKRAMAALFIINSKNGGNLSLDIDSVEFSGIPMLNK